MKYNIKYVQVIHQTFEDEIEADGLEEAEDALLKAIGNGLSPVDDEITNFWFESEVLD